jgi:hypothetical protein
MLRVDAPFTMSTSSPVTSWMAAAVSASRPCAAAAGRPVPRTRTRTTLMKALPGWPWKRAGSASQRAVGRVVSSSGGLDT